ncbi:MAG TPA: NUDIX hydrolase [Myxococcaceae bacterium]|nr:NUDIX hydrolase [Myxococcaceae bacterium]
MKNEREASVVDIEVVEDCSATSRWDEGFLIVRRLRCRNRRSDGSASAVYRVDVVDRPKLDAVAVVIYRRSGSGLEVLTRQNLRPAAYFRREKQPPVPDAQPHLRVEEIVAGVLEVSDKGEEGLRVRAAIEVGEEAGIQVAPDEIQILGGPVFVAPGIISEKIFLTAVDVTGKPEHPPPGDGSPLEEGSMLQWHPALHLLEDCRSGRLQDAKTEIGVARLLAAPPMPAPSKP